MAAGQLAYRLLARHGQAIDRLISDMAKEPEDGDLVRFLAYDTANFVYAFLLATSNKMTPNDRALRNDVQDAILAVLAKYGVDRHSLNETKASNAS